MGFSLKGLLKGVGADLNFWDDGKSHGNMQGKSRPAPASTARPRIRNQFGEVNQGPLEVGPVKKPMFMTNSIAPVQAPQPLQVGVAKQQPLQIGNVNIQPNQNARTAPIKKQPPQPNIVESLVKQIGNTAQFGASNVALGGANLIGDERLAEIYRGQRDKSFQNSLVPPAAKTANMLSELNPVVAYSNNQIDRSTDAALAQTDAQAQKLTKEIKLGINNGNIDPNEGNAVVNQILSQQEQLYKAAETKNQQRLAGAGFDMNTSNLSKGLQAFGNMASTASYGIAPVSGGALAKLGATKAVTTKLVDVGANSALGGLGTGSLTYGQTGDIGESLKAGTVGAGLTAGLMGLGGVKQLSQVNKVRTLPNINKVTTSLVDVTKLVKPKPLNQVGAIGKNISPDIPAPTPKPRNIHPQDQATMNDFVQYTKGKYKPKGKDAHELEIEASRIAEHYGLPMPKTTKELGKAFEKELTTRGFNKPRPIVGAAQQSKLGKSELNEINIKQAVDDLAKISESDTTDMKAWTIAENKLNETLKDKKFNVSLMGENLTSRQLLDYGFDVKNIPDLIKNPDKYYKKSVNRPKVLGRDGEMFRDANGDNYPLNKDGTITVYHQTKTPDSFKHGIEDDGQVFFTNNPKGPGDATYGKNLSFNIKPQLLDDARIKADAVLGEQWFKGDGSSLQGIIPNELKKPNEAGFIAPGQIASDVKSFGNKIKSKFKPLGDQGTLGKADEISPTIKNALTGETIDNPHYKKPETPHEIQMIQNKIDAGEMVSPRNYARAKEWEKTGLDIKAPREAKPIVGPNLSRSSKTPPKSTPIISSKEPTLGVKTPKQVVKEVKSTLEGKPPKQAKAKLVDSASKSNKIPQDIVEAIDPSRSVKTNTESWNNAGQIIYEHGDDGALKYFQENHGAEANAVAWRLFQKRLSSGNKKGAQELLADMTTRSIEDGQSAQAWAMIKKLDPKYIVAKLDREVTRFSNQTSDKLKGRIDWTAEKQAKIMQYSQGLGDDKTIAKLTRINDTAKISKLTGITDKATLKGLAKATDPERVKMYLTNNLNKEINSIIPSGVGDKTIAYWKSGLLSAPVTHVRNIVGNSMNAVANVIETPLAGGFDATVGRALTPTKRTVSANPITGIGRGLKKGGQDFADAIQTGITADDVSKYNYKTVNWNLKNPAEKYVFKPFTDAIFRTLGAEDKIFKAPGVLTSLYNQADAAAISAGKRGDAKWMAKWIEDAPPIVKETAKKEGGQWVFQKDTVVSTGMQALRRGIKQKHPGYEKIVEGIQPFVNVPAAIGSELMTYTPAGLLRVANKSRKAIDKNIDLTVRDTYRRQAMKDLSKTSVGVGILTAGFAMGLSGDASGNMPPKNSREYDQWILENRQPNSIKVGGRWFNINSVGPQLTLFNAAAQTGAQMRRDKNQGKSSTPVDNAISFAGNVGTNFVNSSSLTGATDATNVLKDPTRYGKNYVARQGTSFIPNFAKRAGSGFDPYQHDPENIKDAVQAQIPYLRNKVAPKTDVTGAPVKNNQYGPLAAKALFDPFNVSKSKSSPLADSLADEINTDAKNKVAKDEAKKLIDGGKSTVKAKNGKIVSKIDGTYRTFDNQKDADKAVAKSKFEKSDKSYQVIGDTVFTKNSEGKASQTTKVAYDYKVNTEKLQSYKASGDVENWVNTANAQLDSINKQLKDKNIDPLDKIRLENDAASLQKSVNKYVGYGGFTKPKTGRKGGKGKGKTSSGFDYAKGLSNINKVASGNQNAVRNIVKKNRIVRKARKA